MINKLFLNQLLFINYKDIEKYKGQSGRGFGNMCPPLPLPVARVLNWKDVNTEQ